MKKTFTEDDLIRFIYDEVSQSEKMDIQQAIESDEKLREQFLNTMKVIKEMDGFSMNPSESTVDIIIEHSHHSSPMETSH